MLLHDIAKLLGLQGVTVKEIIHKDNEEVKEAQIYVEPLNHTQACPCCGSKNVIRNGKDGDRQVKHLNIADTQCMLIVPRERLKCKDCGATYAYQYEFITGKQRYTQAYKAQIYELSIGSTVCHAAKVTETPYSTAERFFKAIASRIAPLTVEYAQRLAQEASKLILGIDDFAIRKGHNYNTGIHACAVKAC